MIVDAKQLWIQMENSLVDARADDFRFFLGGGGWVEYSKGLYILTAQKCSGHTADHFPTEHSDTYFHTLQPVVRNDISRKCHSTKIVYNQPMNQLRHPETL
jgi:hypothetical protein